MIRNMPETVVFISIFFTEMGSALYRMVQFIFIVDRGNPVAQNVKRWLTTLAVPSSILSLAEIFSTIVGGSIARRFIINPHCPEKD